MKKLIALILASITVLYVVAIVYMATIKYRQEYDHAYFAYRCPPNAGVSCILQRDEYASSEARVELRNAMVPWVLGGILLGMSTSVVATHEPRAAKRKSEESLA